MLVETRRFTEISHQFAAFTIIPTDQRTLQEKVNWNKVSEMEGMDD
jgi:hypothetical protein